MFKILSSLKKNAEALLLDSPAKEDIERVCTSTSHCGEDVEVLKLWVDEKAKINNFEGGSFICLVRQLNKWYGIFVLY